MTPLTNLEICAGGGGAALGIAEAGFYPVALIEWDRAGIDTLRWNRPEWNVVQQDVCKMDGHPYRGVDLFSGGVPCQPFSTGGKQAGASDERNLFPEALRLIREIEPRAVLLENVPGLEKHTHTEHRQQILDDLHEQGYETWWGIIRACDHGVPQLRPRFVLVAMRQPWAKAFVWPEPRLAPPPTVGDVLYPLMSSQGWAGADAWREGAQRIAPTLSGNAGKTGGGPDLGQTRAKIEWETKLGTNGRGIAESVPGPDGKQRRGRGIVRDANVVLPMLTVEQTALLQGFPLSWQIQGAKTNAYRQVAEAFPPPVARVLASAIATALMG